MNQARPFSLKEHCLKKYLRVYECKTSCNDISSYFFYNNTSLRRLFKNLIKELSSIKFQICMHCVFIKIETQHNAYFCSKTDCITSNAIVGEKLSKAQEEIEILSDLFTQRCSGLSLSHIKVLKYV